MIRNDECEMLKNFQDITMDNQQPSSVDSELLTEKVQRLGGESTELNNPPTSA